MIDSDEEIADDPLPLSSIIQRHDTDINTINTADELMPSETLHRPIPTPAKSTNPLLYDYFCP